MTQKQIEQSQYGFQEYERDFRGYPVYRAAYQTELREYVFTLEKIHDSSSDWLLTRHGKDRKPAGEESVPLIPDKPKRIDSIQRLDAVIQDYKKHALPTE